MGEGNRAAGRQSEVDQPVRAIARPEQTALQIFGVQRQDVVAYFLYQRLDDIGI